MVAMTFDGTTLSISVNNGSPVTVAAGNVSGLAGMIWRLGRNYATNYIAKEVLAVLTAPVDLTSSLAFIKDRFNDRYALSL